MPQTQSAEQLFSSPGFWQQPEDQQIKAVAAIGPKFKEAAPAVQKLVLQKARQKFGSPSQPPAAAPASNVGREKPTPVAKPTEKPIHGMEKLGPRPGPPEPPKPPLPWEMSVQIGKPDAGDIPQQILNKTTAGVGQLAQGVEGMTSDTTKEKFGAAHKLAEGAVGVATPFVMEAALTDPLVFAKTATAAGVSQSVVEDSLKGMGLPEEYAAVAGDLAGVIAGAKAYNRAKVRAQIEPILRERLMKLKQGEMGKGETFARGEETVKVNGKDMPVTERTNPTHAAKAVEARAAGKPPKSRGAAGAEELPSTPEAIERRIGELQDQLNTPGMAESKRTAAEAEIRQLRAAHPETSLDPATAARQVTKPWEAMRNQQSPPPPPDPVREPEGAAAARAAEAQGRQKGPRQHVEGLGYRVAPEETGELPQQKPPRNKGVGVEKPPQPPAVQKSSGEIPDGAHTGAGTALQGQQFTAERLPGVPKGSRVIFREVGEKGTVIDIVDPSGRTTQATLPYRDSVKNMESKGWIKAAKSPVDTFEANRPDTRAQRGLPAPGQTAPPPAGAMKVMSPQELGAHVLQQIVEDSGKGPSPKMIEGPPDPSGAVQQEPKSIEQQVEIAKQQPPEVIQNFITKMQTDFLEKIGGEKVSDMAPEKKAAVLKAYQEMADYLKPFQELLPKAEGGPTQSDAAPPAKVEPPAPPPEQSAAAQAPPKLSAPPPKAPPATSTAADKKSPLPAKKAAAPAAAPPKLSTPPPPVKGAKPAPPPEAAGAADAAIHKTLAKIFKTADEDEVEHVKITLLGADGKPLGDGDVFPVGTDAAALAKHIADIPGIAGFRVEPQGIGFGPEDARDTMLPRR